MKNYIVLLSVLFSLSVVAKALEFQKKTLEINKIKITVEIADSNEKQKQGLMFRTSLKDNQGMLFVFTNEEPRSFWMKNTFVDLSIGFFSKEKKLLEVAQMKAVASEMEQNPPSYQSKHPAQYVLEVPNGWFERHKVKVGDQFQLK